jgi:hypothetical protein
MDFQDMLVCERDFRAQEDLKSPAMSGGEHLKLDFKNQILMMNGKRPLYYRFRDIKAVELIVKESTSTGKSTSSVLGRAAVLGFLTGGVGAIVGGMTAKTVTTHTVKKVHLKFTVKGSDPLYGDRHLETILYQEGSFSMKVADDAIKLGSDVVKKIEAAIAPPDAVTPVEKAPPESLASSLAKLADLHSRGLLTDDEFTAAKAIALA